MNTTIDRAEIDCAEACVNGCILEDKCPNKEYAEATANFISSTSLDNMLNMAEEAIRKKRMEPPKWIIPDFPE
ncbi:MAG: hypothetical protein ACRC8A_20870 [Microcoleaceae cyanobacterium]